MGALDSLLSSASSEWRTPPALFASLDAQLAFTVDAAATAHNRLVARHWSEADNGLAQPWEGETVWLNPPYGRALPAWIERSRRAAVDERAIVCALVPYRPDTEWFLEFVMQTDGEAGRLLGSRYEPTQRIHWHRWARCIVGVHAYRGRLAFLEPDGSARDAAPFPAAVVLFAHPSRRPAPGRRVVSDGDPKAPLLTVGWPR